MTRRTRRLAPLALAALPVLAAALLGGCQDYTFSPVKYCLIQPGTERVRLSDVSTADVLFVVDDSGSMGGEQQKLAQSFKAFVDRIIATNIARVQVLPEPLDPIDFHVAITTTSVFINQPTSTVCQSTCAGTGGALVCCGTDNSRQPLLVPRACATVGSASGCGTGNTCRDDCQARRGEPTCCSASGAVSEKVPLACDVPGEACGNVQTRYGTTRVPASCVGGVSCPTGTTCRTDCPGMLGAQACCDPTGLAPVCDPGVGAAGELYPRGRFVASGANPKVLHFDKDLFCQWDATAKTCLAAYGQATIEANTASLTQQFRENVLVGTCGAGQEQPFEAARRAIQLAQAGDQPGVAQGEWLHVDGQGKPTSKLVVVFVGDEDDCSAREASTGGVVFTDASCAADTTRRFPAAEYADFLASLGRPVAGAFIVSATSETCEDGACNPGLCCDTVCTGSPAVCNVGGLCGGQGDGLRMIELSAALAGRGGDRVVGSICHPGLPDDPLTPANDPKPGFSSILERIAEVVKQPTGLQLPTQPATEKLTILRIVDAGGATRKTCAGPAPVGTSGAALDAYDWWFTGGNDLDRTPTGPSRFLFLNLDSRRCEANPGETYSADYLGQVPAGGCGDASECAAALGGSVESWRCCTGVAANGTCTTPPPNQTAIRGTCLCGGP